MNITINETFDYGWDEHIYCTCWFEDMKSQYFFISKKKLLKYFSEKDELDDFHLLLLDNIIKTLSFVYYTKDSKFNISLYGDKRIVIHIPQKDFEDIVKNCTAD